MLDNHPSATTSARLSVKQFFASVRDTVRTQLWPLPLLGVVAATTAGTLLPRVDSYWDKAAPPWLSAAVFGGDAGAARTLLNVISTSLITVTSLTFSLTVVTLQLASSQFSPSGTSPPCCASSPPAISGQCCCRTTTGCEWYCTRPDLTYLLDEAITQPRHYGSSDLQVMMRLFRLVEELAYHVDDQTPIQAQRDRLLATVARSDFDSTETAQLHQAAQRVEHAIARHRDSQRSRQ